MNNSIIISNWKLHGNKDEISLYLNKLIPFMENIKNCHVSIALPHIYLYFAQKILCKVKNISLSAQNVDLNNYGAFTGETSIFMLKEIGVKYVLVGHSERRKYHNENNKIVAKKFKIVKKNGLIPVLCIGETYEDKIHKKTKKVLKKQIDQIFLTNKNNYNLFNNSIIAYEPIWAIGTGISANHLDIKKINLFIKKYIFSKNNNIKQNNFIQYGGSVNYKNIKNIFDQTNINHFLIGSSSLNINEFFKIIKYIDDNIKIK
ncbi:triose-phosphate isomerase [Buchnera aphidicola (Taiwanaphis decaspermi)]|uniref:triose-phosphate isomerase n=1 Tax=Buchnera aphidicola TaxID=9 RepID=UPI0031B8A9FB